jgi:hypothetical protein
LGRLAGAWQEPAWLSSALWPLLEKNPRERWALLAQRSHLLGRRDADGLWRLHELWLAKADEEPAVRAGWLMLSALLNRAPERREQVARELAQGVPSGDKVLALVAHEWRAGRLVEAQTRLASLSPEAQTQAKVRFWQGLIASSAEDWERAASALAAIEAQGWLDAERALLEVARARILASQTKVPAEDAEG